MKKILVILIAIIIVIFILFKVIATKPPSFLPGAAITDSKQTNGTTLGEIIFGSTSIIKSSTTPKGSSSFANGIESAKFNFTGYGPGKEHVGTFKSIKYDVKFSKEGKVESGTVSISASSVEAGNSILNKDLCGSTFFDCVKNPNILFSINKVDIKIPTTTTSATGTVIGTLNFKGKTKSVAFPVTYTRSARPGDAIGVGTYQSDFRLNMKDFYSTPLVNDEVRIQISVVTQ